MCSQRDARITWHRIDGLKRKGFWKRMTFQYEEQMVRPGMSSLVVEGSTFVKVSKVSGMENLDWCQPVLALPAAIVQQNLHIQKPYTSDYAMSGTDSKRTTSSCLAWVSREQRWQLLECKCPPVSRGIYSSCYCGYLKPWRVANPTQIPPIALMADLCPFPQVFQMETWSSFCFGMLWKQTARTWTHSCSHTRGGDSEKRRESRVWWVGI